MLVLQAGPEWRNWQTQQTQNLPDLCSVWVRLPPPGPVLLALQVFRSFVLRRRVAEPFYRLSCTDFSHIPICQGALSMLETVLKRFEDPDEVRTFEKGKFEVVRIG